MKNRTAGLLVIGAALFIGFIIYLFNRALTEIVNTSCEHGSACPMWKTIDFQTNIGIAIMTLVVAAGLYLVFFAREEKPLVPKIKIVAPQFQAKKPSKENYQKIFAALDPESRAVLEKIIEAEGAALQSAIVESTGLTKVKITRILDRLESHGLIERRRRGMTNVIVLKQQ